MNHLNDADQQLDGVPNRIGRELDSSPLGGAPLKAGGPRPRPYTIKTTIDGMRIALGFLCIEDSLAERVGFELAGDFLSRQ